MNGPEQGFLLLTSTLGDTDRRPLTIAQFRNLAKRAQNVKRDISPRELEVSDFEKMGYDRNTAEHMYGLLSGSNQLREYLRRAELCDCIPITRLNPAYPLSVRKRLGLDSPGVLWAKGDVTLLNRPAVSVIGSRDLLEENRKFAEKAGRNIAQQGYVLVSGNARGADKVAQDAALEVGGRVISIVADSLQKKPLQKNCLYLSLDEFDADFSSQRALRRNHVIHSFGCLTIAAQCSFGKGGTWDGILANLKYGWTPVCVFEDGSAAAADLKNRGASTVNMTDLDNLALLASCQISLL